MLHLVIILILLLVSLLGVGCLGACIGLGCLGVCFDEVKGGAHGQRPDKNGGKYFMESDPNFRKTGSIPVNDRISRIASIVKVPNIAYATFEWAKPVPDPRNYVGRPLMDYPEYWPGLENRFYIEYVPHKGKEKEFQRLKDAVTLAIIKDAEGTLTKKDINDAEGLIRRFDGMIDSIFDRKIGSDERKPIKCSKVFESSRLKKLHWGQRKLMLSEIQLLNECHDKRVNVVYPGSAIGTHLLLLMDMFPNIVLHLWDPAKFHPILYASDFKRRGLPVDGNHVPKYDGRVFINPELDNDTYKKYYTFVTGRSGSYTDTYDKDWGMFLPRSIDWVNRNLSYVVFISDIRLFSEKHVLGFFMKNNMKEMHDPIIRWATTKGNANQFRRDMMLQQSWVNAISPRFSLLKFKPHRLYEGCDTHYTYLSGDIWLQAFGGSSSTETRLFIDSEKHKGVTQYDVVAYERKMSYFNAKMRTLDMSNIALRDIGINGDGTIGDIWGRFGVTGADALLETQIMHRYVENKLGASTLTIEGDKIVGMINKLSSFLGPFAKKLNTTSAIKKTICQLRGKKFR